VRGLLVVIEGIDGGGKTTLSRGLAADLRALGHSVVETREPTEGPFGQEIRALAANGRHAVSAEAEFRLFHEDRKEHIARVVGPALERGAIVLQDRSYFSSIAYQGERGLDRAFIRSESEKVAPKPDLLLVVDLPAELALERIKTARKTAADDFEKLESLRRIREVFLTEACEGKTLIDATTSPEAMRAAARAAILARLEDRRLSD
jgi:dTMP kinase